MKRVLALILSFSLLFGIVCCGKEEFDYVTGDMTDWLDIVLSDFTGGTYDLDMPDEITQEDVLKQLRYFQLYYAVHGGNASKDIYLTRPEFTDVAFFYYDVAMTPDGESVFSNLFSEEGPRSITIGLWEFPDGKVDKANPLFDNKTFSDALTETLPASRVMEGTVELGDVVVIDYSVINEKNVTQGTATGVRIDTAKLPLYEGLHPGEVFSDLVGQTIGETYVAERTFTPEGASEEITYTYKYKIRHKVQETPQTVAVTLDADAFDETYNENLQAMNGKTVYVRYVISRYIDFDPPALDSTFYIDTLGLVTEETDVAKIEQLAHEQIKEKLEQERLANLVFPAIEKLVFDGIFARTDPVKKLPGDLVEKEYNELIEQITSAYEVDKQSSSFPYKDIDEYAAAYLDYSAEEYPTIKDVCRAEAEAEITVRILYFAVAQLAGIRYTPEKCEEYYVTYLAYQISGYTKEAYGIFLTDEERAEIHRAAGEDKTDQLYEELIHLLVKHYAIYEQLSTTAADLKKAIGSKEDFLLEGLLEITKMNVREYLYENNTWNDTNP